MANLESVDPDIKALLLKEAERQERGIELIASENIASDAVRAAMASTLTNKYAEGLPGRRYYGGCEVVDEVETLAIERARSLFGAEAANVQPHSGAQANMAVFFSVLDPGDAFLSMRLDEGGHLTHGAPVNFSGRLYRPIHYGLQPETHRIDYDAIADLLKTHRPKLLVAGASAYPRTIDFDRIAEMCRETDTRMLADIAHIAGLVVAGLHPSPVPVADYVTTTTHKTLRGPRGGLILTKADHAKTVNSRVFPGMQGGPLMHVIAAKAVAFREAAQPAFRDYQARVIALAQTMADGLLARGFRLISGGTDNHLLLIDAKHSRGITGKQAEQGLGRVGITVNKNMIPGDTESPFVTSGIRIGTPAIATRGFDEAAVQRLVGLIDDVLSAPEDAAVAERVRGGVAELTAQFPTGSKPLLA